MISRERINYIEYLIRKNKLQYKLLEPIQLSKGVYVINVPVNKMIQGIVNGRKNMLVYNFWGLVFGLLAKQVNPQMFVSGHTVNAVGGPAYLEYGTGTSQTTFGMNGLQSASGSISTQLTIATLSDRTRISAVGVLPASAYEIGLFENMSFPAWGSSYPVMFGRVTGTFNANTTITYYVDFLNPWTQNMAQLVFSFFTSTSSSSANVNVVDVTGTKQSVAWNSYNNPAVLIGSQNTYTWSPTIYSVSQDVTFSTNHNFQFNQNYVVDYILGTYQPSSQISIQTLALIQEYGGYNLLLLVLPLSSPITLVPNQQNFVYLRLVAQ